MGLEVISRLCTMLVSPPPHLHASAMLLVLIERNRSSPCRPSCRKVLSFSNKLCQE